METADAARTSGLARPSPRQRLLDAAEELFYAHGIGNTGVDAVVRTADVARKTLYHQFGGKDGLTVAYLRARDERWTAHWGAAIEAREGATDRLLAIFDALETWEPSRRRPRGCAFLDALVEVADPSHPVAEAVRDHWATMTARLTELAAAADAPEPEATAADLLVIYRGTLTAMMTEPVDVAVPRGRTLARRCLVR